MAIERSNRRVAASRIAASAQSLLDASSLCAIATVGSGGSAHVNAAYFAWSRDFEIVWLSDPRADHSRNLRANGSTAIAVYDSAQTWGDPDRGIQLFGSAGEAEDEGAARARMLYARRFPRFVATDLAAYRFYVFRAQRLKLFDEQAIGAGTFVTARVGRDGRLEWERTEIYRPGG
jgi:uncharacterized protein YhbP (UPF0306 family)